MYGILFMLHSSHEQIFGTLSRTANPQLYSSGLPSVGFLRFMRGQGRRYFRIRLTQPARSAFALSRLLPSSYYHITAVFIGRSSGM